MLPETYLTTGFFPMQMALDAAYIEMVSTKSFSELPYKVSKRSFRQYLLELKYHHLSTVMVVFSLVFKKNFLSELQNSNQVDVASSQPIKTFKVAVVYLLYCTKVIQLKILINIFIAGIGSRISLPTLH